MGRMVVVVQCVALALITLLSAFCVFLHDTGGGNIGRESEPMWMRFGHFEMVLIEDLVVVGLLAGAMLLSAAGTRKLFLQLRVALIAFASVVLGFELFCQIGVLCHENQQLLTEAATFARVAEVLLTTAGALWSFFLSLFLWVTLYATTDFGYTKAAEVTS